MSKKQQQQINDLTETLTAARAELRHSAGRAVIERDMRRKAEESAETAEHKAKTEAEKATLASIKAGMVPVAELRQLVMTTRKEVTEGGVVITSLDLEVTGTPNAVQAAILAALSKQEERSLSIGDRAALAGLLGANSITRNASIFSPGFY